MTNGEIVRAVALWMEGRWAEDLSVPTLAAKAGYSLHHFSRLFSGVVGMPPKEYVLRRRLSEAARDLSGGRRRVTDVAFDYGFRDLETFTRAFSRVLGSTPSAVRRGSTVAHFAGLSDGAATAVEAGNPLPGVSSSIPLLEPSPAFLLAGWMLRVSEDPSLVGRLWARFIGRAPSIPHRLEPIRFRQLATWAEDAEDWVDIMTGVEMETLDSLEIDLVGKAVPACDCLVFEHRGSAAHVAESYRAIYAEILPAMDRKPILPFNFETYYPDAGDPYASDYHFRICVPLA